MSFKSGLMSLINAPAKVVQTITDPDALGEAWDKYGVGGSAWDNDSQQNNLSGQSGQLGQGGGVQGGGAQGGGYNVDQITSQIQGLLDTGTDPAIEAEYQQSLGQGYRDAEMGAAARGVTGYGGLQKSKASVRRQAEIDRSRASMQQKQMNQQLAIQWTQQLLAQKQLTQEGALAMAEIQLGGADWIHQNHPSMGKFMPEIQSKVAKYLEKNPNDYMGAATLYTQLFNEALAKTGVHA